jgi:hypothetical protein
MKYGVFQFSTDYSIRIDDLAREAEARGFESLFVPEHTHIPASRKSPWPGGADLPREYWHTVDPFVGLAAAAAVTSKIKLGTGICLVIERDPIVLAKEVASGAYETGLAVAAIALEGFPDLAELDLAAAQFALELGEFAQAAVIGLPGGDAGEKIHAIVVSASETRPDANEILRRCALKLPSYMLPRSIEVVEMLPKTPNGKIDYKGLRAQRMESRP